MARMISTVQRLMRPQAGSAAWTETWRFSPLPVSGRYALLGAVAVATFAETVLAVSEDEPTQSTLIDIATLGLIGLFAWRPPVAALGLMIGGAYAAIAGLSGPYALAMAIASGILVTTCSTTITIAYALTMVIWIAVAAFSRQELTETGALMTMTVATASTLAGWGYRRVRDREQALSIHMDALEHETAEALQTERERIADELHNIIAHDITIVVMHVKALELVEDPASRGLSMRAISDSATQALTDIRRMLRIVHDTDDEIETVTAESGELEMELSAIASELEAFGARVSLELPEHRVSVSPTIATTLTHIAREAATNIMKHARGTPSVRMALQQGESSVTLTAWNAPTRTKVDGEDTPPSGYGLKRMQDRVALLGGSFTAAPEHSGWLVSSTLPLS